MRFAIGIEYQGAAFSGWQALPGQRTVQAELDRAISLVADQPVGVTGAGRTDSGVHALQQIAHFDSDAQRRADAWLLGVNSNLPEDLSVLWIREVSAEFHARFGAIQRSYRYVIHNSRVRRALISGSVTRWPRALDASAMHEAAQVLVGEHDFSAFRDSQCQAPNPVRKLSALSVHRSGEFVVLDVSGNAFLHHMVRNIVGTLLQVGMGKKPARWVAEVLALRDRTQAGMTAPAEGLYFVGPEYPAEFALPPVPRPWFPPVFS